MKSTRAVIKAEPSGRRRQVFGREAGREQELEDFERQKQKTAADGLQLRPPMMVEQQLRSADACSICEP
jgi:hypothetical protein